jgi:aminopeptidase S
MRRRVLLAVLAVLLLGSLTLLSFMRARTPMVKTTGEVDSTKLRHAVTVNGIQRHLHAFQSFANQSHGTRVDGTVGFQRSVDYVAAKARAAGYHVTVQPFTFRPQDGPAQGVPIRSANVLADTPGGDPNHIVVLGAHLDSVLQGPGLNDNGSGSAAILEIALQLRRLGIRPVNRVRFAWWGAEEFDLNGAQHYLDDLPKSQLKSIALYLNFDPIASPNFVRFVFDGDGSDTGPGGPPGSVQIEQQFQRYFASRGLATDPTPFEPDDSDYGPFIGQHIPSGGLYSGDDEIKTARQAAVYGGTAGVADDHCYDQPCDTVANINNTALAQMSGAIADATMQFGMTNPPVSVPSRNAVPLHR